MEQEMQVLPTRNTAALDTSRSGTPDSPAHLVVHVDDSDDQTSHATFTHSDDASSPDRLTKTKDRVYYGINVAYFIASVLTLYWQFKVGSEGVDAATRTTFGESASDKVKVGIAGTFALIAVMGRLPLLVFTPSTATPKPVAAKQAHFPTTTRGKIKVACKKGAAFFVNDMVIKGTYAFVGGIAGAVALWSSDRVGLSSTLLAFTTLANSAYIGFSKQASQAYEEGIAFWRNKETPRPYWFKEFPRFHIAIPAQILVQGLTASAGYAAVPTVSYLAVTANSVIASWIGGSAALSGGAIVFAGAAFVYTMMTVYPKVYSHYKAAREATDAALMKTERGKRHIEMVKGPADPSAYQPVEDEFPESEVVTFNSRQKASIEAFIANERQNIIHGQLRWKGFNLFLTKDNIVQLIPVIGSSLIGGIMGRQIAATFLTVTSPLVSLPVIAGVVILGGLVLQAERTRLIDQYITAFLEKTGNNAASPLAKSSVPTQVVSAVVLFATQFSEVIAMMGMANTLYGKNQFAMAFTLMLACNSLLHTVIRSFEKTTQEMTALAASKINPANWGLRVPAACQRKKTEFNHLIMEQSLLPIERRISTLEVKVPADSAAIITSAESHDSDERLVTALEDLRERKRLEEAKIQIRLQIREALASNLNPRSAQPSATALQSRAFTARVISTQVIDPAALAAAAARAPDFRSPPHELDSLPKPVQRTQPTRPMIVPLPASAYSTPERKQRNDAPVPESPAVKAARSAIESIGSASKLEKKELDAGIKLEMNRLWKEAQKDAPGLTMREFASRLSENQRHEIQKEVKRILIGEKESKVSQDLKQAERDLIQEASSFGSGKKPVALGGEILTAFVQLKQVKQESKEQTKASNDSVDAPVEVVLETTPKQNVAIDAVLAVDAMIAGMADKLEQAGKNALIAERNLSALKSKKAKAVQEEKAKLATPKKAEEKSDAPVAATLTEDKEPRGENKGLDKLVSAEDTKDTTQSPLLAEFKSLDQKEREEKTIETKKVAPFEFEIQAAEAELEKAKAEKIKLATPIKEARKKAHDAVAAALKENKDIDQELSILKELDALVAANDAKESIQSTLPALIAEFSNRDAKGIEQNPLIAELRSELEKAEDNEVALLNNLRNLIAQQKARQAELQSKIAKLELGMGLFEATTGLCQEADKLLNPTQIKQETLGNPSKPKRSAKDVLPFLSLVRPKPSQLGLTSPRPVVKVKDGKLVSADSAIVKTEQSETKVDADSSRLVHLKLQGAKMLPFLNLVRPKKTTGESKEPSRKVGRGADSATPPKPVSAEVATTVVSPEEGALSGTAPTPPGAKIVSRKTVAQMRLFAKRRHSLSSGDQSKPAQKIPLNLTDGEYSKKMGLSPRS